MEAMPYTRAMDQAAAVAALTHQPLASPVHVPATTQTNWQEHLPVLVGQRMTLRALRPEDAPALCALLTADEVTRFISPPPTTVEGFERFITWAAAEQAAGRYACFAVVPHGMDTAVGLFQVRQLDQDFQTAEWGFALGSAFWGTGLFKDGAEQVLGFAFTTLGVHRLEARAAVANGRGNGALAKMGAVAEGLLRDGLFCRGQHHDQRLWALLANDWFQRRAIWGQRIH